MVDEDEFRSWARLNELPLYVIACLAANKPPVTRIDRGLQLANLKTLKEAIREGKLKRTDMVSDLPNVSTTVTRADLYNFAKTNEPKYGDFIALCIALETADVAKLPGAGKASAKRVSRTHLSDWYQRQHVPTWQSAGRIPSEKDELAAAQNLFPGVTRELIREMRREFAPQPWKAKGRRTAVLGGRKSAR